MSNNSIPSWLEADAGELAPNPAARLDARRLSAMGAIRSPFGGDGGLPVQYGTESPYAVGDLAGLSGVGGAQGFVTTIR